MEKSVKEREEVKEDAVSVEKSQNTEKEIEKVKDDVVKKSQNIEEEKEEVKEDAVKKSQNTEKHEDGINGMRDRDTTDGTALDPDGDAKGQQQQDDPNGDSGDGSTPGIA